jgi:hypothetical protein
MIERTFRLSSAERADEHRLPRLECALQLRIPVEIDDEIADRRIFVACNETHAIRVTREIDRAPVETKRLAELPGD